MKLTAKRTASPHSDLQRALDCAVSAATDRAQNTECRAGVAVMRWAGPVDNSLAFNLEEFYAEVNEGEVHRAWRQNLTLSRHRSAGYHPGSSAGNRHDVYLRGADSQSRCCWGKCSRQDTDCRLSKPGALEQSTSQ